MYFTRDLQQYHTVSNTSTIDRVELFHTISESLLIHCVQIWRQGLYFYLARITSILKPTI